MVDRCVCCGEIIPEGRQVCPSCEEKEKRLIDANALRTQFDDIPPFIGMTGGCVQQFIDKAPTVDAVEVVRCKDCRYYKESEIFKGVKFCYRLRGRGGKPVGYNFCADDFCSRGERKNDEN